MGAKRNPGNLLRIDREENTHLPFTDAQVAQMTYNTDIV